MVSKRRLVNHTPRQAFAGQDGVLRSQISVGDAVQFVEFLNGGNVWIFFLNLHQHLGAVHRFLFERGDEGLC